MGVLELVSEALGHADTSFCLLSFLASFATLDNLAAETCLKMIDHYPCGKIMTVGGVITGCICHLQLKTGKGIVKYICQLVILENKTLLQK